jgi:hypothetical protein
MSQTSFFLESKMLFWFKLKKALCMLNRIFLCSLKRKQMDKNGFRLVEITPFIFSFLHSHLCCATKAENFDSDVLAFSYFCHTVIYFAIHCSQMSWYSILVCFIGVTFTCQITSPPTRFLRLTFSNE